MEILTVRELANYLKVSVSTIRRLILKKEIPYYRVSSQIFFNKEVINEWVKTQINSNIERNI